MNAHKNNAEITVYLPEKYLSVIKKKKIIQMDCNESILLQHAK